MNRAEHQINWYKLVHRTATDNACSTSFHGLHLVKETSIMRTADCILIVRICSHSRVARVAHCGWRNTSNAHKTSDPLHFAYLSPEHNGETSTPESVSQYPALLYGNEKATGRCYRRLRIVTFLVFNSHRHCSRLNGNSIALFYFTLIKMRDSLHKSTSFGARSWDSQSHDAVREFYLFIGNINNLLYGNLK